MFETIIWPTDGSDLSDSGLALVTELARVHCSKIIALHVDERFGGGHFARGPMLVDEDRIRRKIEWQVEELREAGFDAELEIAVTYRYNPATSIAEAAADLGADLIVVVSRGGRRTGDARPSQRRQGPDPHRTLPGAPGARYDRPRRDGPPPEAGRLGSAQSDPGRKSLD
jgi:nucleotide-binding universal stress UspA family protein